jgi:hypothetical protein
VNPALDLEDAKVRAREYFQQKVRDADEWDLAETREGKFQTRQSSSTGWFITFRRRPDPGGEGDWRTTLGIVVFVDGQSGRAEMIR